MAQWIAHFLDPKAKIVYATPRDGRPTVSGGLEDLIRGRRVLLVDNLIVSGETMGRFAPMIDGLGATVVGLATLWNSGDRQLAGHDVFGLLNTIYDVYPAADCPLCVAGGEPTPVPY